MDTFYFRPFRCSLVAHGLLHELDHPHRAVPLGGDARGAGDVAYAAISPLRTVPALVTEAGPLFQSAAILLHLAERHGRDDLLPRDPARRASALSWLSFVTSDVHPSFRTLFTPERYVDGDEARATLRERSVARLSGQLAVLDAALAGRAFLGGDELSLADGYLLVFSLWCRNLRVPVPARVAEVAATIAARPGFARALEIETPLFTG